MRVVELRKMLLYGMMGTAFLALQLSQEIHPIVIVGFWLGMLVSWFWEEPRIAFDRWARPWTWATLGVFAFSVFDVTLGGEFFLISAMNFVLFLACAKMFQRALHKDYVQAMALSLLVLTAATALNENVSFGVLFGAYVLLATVGLTMQHVAVETATWHSRLARGLKVERSVVTTTVALGLLVFLGAAAFFFTFPRLGFGMFMQQSRRGVMMSGFGENVELGSHGTIGDNSQVVLRAIFQGEPPTLPESFHWRGLSLDHWDGRRWSDRDSRELSARRYPEVDGFAWGRTEGGRRWEEIVDGLWRVEIYQEPMQTDVLFSLGFMQAVQFPPLNPLLRDVPCSSAVMPHDTGKVTRCLTGSTPGVRYVAWGRPNRVREDALRQAVWDERWPDLGAWARHVLRTDPATEALAPEEDDDGLPVTWLSEAALMALQQGEMHNRRGETTRIARRYLQLPASGVSERQWALGSELRLRSDSAWDYAVRLESWLQTELAYTTTLTEPDPANPDLIDQFLFEWRQGHCEYFATAMVLLLRQQGIPARIVNGFLGGRWNPVGGYFAVQQGDAHSWVEAYFPGEGWIEFDPTPPASTEVQSQGLFARLNMAFDSLRLVWFRWVVEYDIQKQVSLFREAANMLSGNQDGAERGLDQQRRDLSERGLQTFLFVWRRFRALSMLGLWMVAAGLFYRARARGRWPWDRVDWLGGAAWALAAVLTVVWLWPRWWTTGGLVAALVPVALGMGWAWLLRRLLLDEGEGPQTRRAGPMEVSRWYGSLIRETERWTEPLPLSMTPGEFVRVVEPGPTLHDALRAFFALYSEVRFAGTPLGPEATRTWRREVRRLRNELRTHLREQARTRAASAAQDPVEDPQGPRDGLVAQAGVESRPAGQ